MLPQNPLSGESLIHRTAITTDDARLDVRARGFWSAAQDAYFDVRVFHPNASSNTSAEPTPQPIHNYRVRLLLFPCEPIRQPFVEGCGHPPSGGEYKRREYSMLNITNTLAVCPFLDVLMLFVGSFAAVRSSIMCIRGTRSSNKRPLRDADIALATSEGGIPQD